MIVLRVEGTVGEKNIKDFIISRLLEQIASKHRNICLWVGGGAEANVGMLGVAGCWSIKYQ